MKLSDAAGNSMRLNIRKLCAALLTMLLVGAHFQTSPANAQSMDMSCATGSEDKEGMVECDFELSQPLPLEDLVFKVNEEILEGADFTPYSGTGSTSAFLFLVDTSNPNRAATVQRNIDIVRDQMRFASASRLVGFATFANDLTLVFKPSSSHSSVETRLNAIVADGAATEFFSNSLEAINILKEVTADRRSLIIMSDGKAEDTAYNRTDVLKAANDAGVKIIGIGFAERSTETPALQEIRRLAIETGGHFESVVGAEALPEDFLPNLPRYVENGGKVAAPLNGKSGTLELSLVANFSNGGSLNASDTVEVAAPEPEPEPVIVKTELSLIGKIYSIFDGLSPGTSDFAETNPIFAYLLLLLIPVILLLIIAYFMMKDREEDAASKADIEEIEAIDFPEDLETEEGMTRSIDGAESNPLGYFEVVGSEQNTYPIPGKSVSIGRHSDNDIQLTNDSVHRHHAHFTIAPSGVSSIQDLKTTNGVFVNGEKIDKINLKSGDILELGEVRIRYVT